MTRNTLIMLWGGGLAVAIGCGSGSGRTMPAPTLLAPRQGEATGSVWSPRAAPNPRCPEFRWAAADGATRYDIQVDDSCTNPRTCAFLSPEVDASPLEAVFSPCLDVSMVAPVGRRYFWRVRACLSESCGAWSRTGYVDVGRQRQDWNINGTRRSTLLLFAREPSVAGRPLALDSNEPAAGPGACDSVLPQPAGNFTDRTLLAAADAGDVDEDGYGDILVGDQFNNRALLYFGGCPVQQLLELPGMQTHDGTPVAGYSVAAVGDMDGDGFPELAVGNPYAGIDTFLAGEVYLYRGGTRGNATPAAVLMHPDNPARNFDSDGFGASVD